MAAARVLAEINANGTSRSDITEEEKEEARALLGDKLYGPPAPEPRPATPKR